LKKRPRGEGGGEKRKKKKGKKMEKKKRTGKRGRILSYWVPRTLLRCLMKIFTGKKLTHRNKGKGKKKRRKRKREEKKEKIPVEPANHAGV